MKKGWKIFWILCICLAVLGIAFCVSGAVLGATAKGVRQVLKIGERYETYDEYDYTDEADTARERNETADAGETGESLSMEYENIRELDVDIICPHLVIEEYEGDSIRVETSGIPENIQNDMTFRADDGELKIDMNNKKVWLNRYKTSKAMLTIWIPADYPLKEASFSVDAGELNINNINAKELKIDIGAGAAVVKEFTADKFELECGAGEADIAGTANREIQIECGVGEVSFQAAGKQQDYNYELSCGVGELQVGSDSYSGLARKTKIQNGGNIEMEIECGIGEVSVSFREEL